MSKPKVFVTRIIPDKSFEMIKDFCGVDLWTDDLPPLQSESPLLTLDNVVIMPHIASASKTAHDKMAWMAAKNLIAGLKDDHLPNCVNPQVYAK